MFIMNIKDNVCVQTECYKAIILNLGDYLLYLRRFEQIKLVAF